VDALELPYPVNTEPLTLTEEGRWADPFHEGTVTNPNERDNPLGAQLKSNIVPSAEAPELLPPAASGQGLKPILIEL
jgi:hypothetical protein